jgi:hypothetical protein
MSESGPDKVNHAKSAIQRVVEAARQGQARLNAETAALGTWLRSHLFRQGSKGQRTEAGRSARSVVTARRLRARQEVHRNGGGHSSVAARALQRVAEATGRKKDR